MKIAYASDFHFEFYNIIKVTPMIDAWRFEPDTDYIVIAGDLCVGAEKAIRLLKYIHQVHNIHVFYVPGNHEYYGSSFVVENEIFLKNMCTEEYTILFSNFPYTVSNDLTFFGCVGNIDGSYEDINRYTHRALNDFISISDFDKDHKRMGREEYNNLWNALQEYSWYIPKMIVVTHTMPDPKCISKRYAGDYLNACFTNSWSELMVEFNPQYWICGHTHDRNEVQLADTTILMNPHGYPKENYNWKWEYITV